MYAFILICTRIYYYIHYMTGMYSDWYVPVHTIMYSYSNHIIRVLPHGLGQWSTSSLAIVHHDVNRLVPCCTAPFHVYSILRDLENHVLCTGMNWYVHVLWQFKAVYSCILKFSLRILYT